MSKKYNKNEDKQITRFIEMQIRGNSGYCPSKSVRNDDTRCPCRELREDGVCECGLYQAKRKKDKMSGY